MTTYNTRNPLGSAAAKDLYDNAENFDRLSNDQINELWKDRFGVDRLTWHGMEMRYQEKLTSMGWTLMESFQDGAALTRADQALHWKLPDGDGEYYRWDGALPKTVPADSTPATTGGVGPGAWVGIGDAALRSMLASSTGSSMIGLPAGGVLSDTIHSVSVEQWSHLVNVDNDWSEAIQAAIDYMYAAGGGKVILGAKVYRATNLILKPRVVIQGQTKETTMIKAPDNWTGNAVVMWQGYLTYKTDSATQVTPGCFSAGLRNLTIHGNKQNFGGTPSQTIGNGVLAAGANLILDDIKIIYVPAVGLVTLDWGANRAQYQAVDPDRGWAHIGTIRGIRIQFCGNDCWHCEAQDYYLDDVEIVGAGDGFTSDVDTFSFWDTDELVSNFRVWRNIDIGFFHSYGNYNGYGAVFGPDTVTFFIRCKYTSIIVESCCIGAWFKSSAYVQGSKLDFHEISQQKLVAKHGTLLPPALVIESGNTKSSNYGSIEGVQTGGDATGPSYSGVGLYLGGQYNIVECFKFSRSPTVGQALRGTGLVVEGLGNQVKSGIIKGCYATDNRGTPSSCIVASSGTHQIDIDIAFANVGVRFIGGHLMGRVNNLGNITTWQSGFDSETIFLKSQLELLSGTGSNRQTIRGGAGAVNTASTSDQEVLITGLNLPYIPIGAEVSPFLVIDAYAGSSIYPRASAINYNRGNSTTAQLSFIVRLSNADSPMQVTVGAKLN